jgi:hypothetical protein
VIDKEIVYLAGPNPRTDLRRGGGSTAPATGGVTIDILGPATPEDQMADVTYPKGLSKELARELYGEVEVPWSSKPFVYDESRSECRFWLEQCSTGIPAANTAYTATQWPQLVGVIRRGEDNAVRVFQWSNGLVYEQET